MLVLATGNERKIQEATNTLLPMEVHFEVQNLEIDEIQSSDSAEIAKAKARTAYAMVGEAVVVSDTSWSIPALGGFPGGYMKDIARWWSVDDWLTVMARHADKRIFCHEHVAFFDGYSLEHFESQYEGRFITEKRGDSTAGESFESVVILYGEQTMAEQLAAGQVASAAETLSHWQQFGAWYRANYA